MRVTRRRSYEQADNTPNKRPKPSTQVNNEPTPINNDRASAIVDEHSNDRLFTDAEKVLDHLSTSDLKKVFGQILEDATAGPIAERILKPYTVKVPASSCHLSELSGEERRFIESCTHWTLLLESISGLIDVAKRMHMQGIGSSSPWPRDLEGFFPRIYDMSKRNPRVDDAKLAWDALLIVAKACMYDWEDDGYRVQEKKTQCNAFQNQVDNLMLAVCKAQKADRNMDWLCGERVKEIRVLASQARTCIGSHVMYGRSACRYQKSLQFLQSLQVPSGF